MSGLALLAFVGIAVGLRYHAQLKVAYESANEARQADVTSRENEERQRRRAEDAFKDAENSRSAEEQQRKIAE